MTLSELLAAAADSPLLYGILVAVGAVVYAVERLGGIDGPVTRAVRAWQNRELNRLRREALLRAEQRKIEAEAESDRVRTLTDEVRWLTRERDDQRRRDRLRDTHDRQLAAYLDHLLRAARTAGVIVGDPPPVPNLAPLYVSGDEARPPLPPRGPATNPLRRETARPRPAPR